MEKAKTKPCDDHEKDEEDTQLRRAVVNDVLAPPTDQERSEKIELYANKSISFFSFDDPKFSIPAFKKQWHDNLDQIPIKLQLDANGKKIFGNRMVEECCHAIQTLLDSIASFEKNLEKNVI